MDLNKRINRMIGQLKGIQRMVDENRDCSEVLQQISAVKKAIDGLSKEIIVTNLGKYIPKEDEQKIAQMVERAINL